MSADEKFDVIVIGAGPAGSACAYILAKEGKSVLLVERGVSAGCKNVTGGRLYTYAMELVEPGLYQEAPLERKIVKEQIMMLSEKGAVNVDYTNYGFSEKEAPPHSYSVLRALFDEWFAAKAEEAGAMLAAGVLVDELIEKGGKIIGIKAGGDEIEATIVIAADGVNSFIAQKAGLRKDILAYSVGVGAKEIIKLPKEVIENRFNLNSGEGAARMILGCSEDVLGGGFLYTNEDSISLGVVLNPEDLAGRRQKIYDIVQNFKMHPAVQPLIKGGETVEYGAHLVSEHGYHALPKCVYRDGLILIGDAAGFVVNTGMIIRGIDLAIVSAVAAARAIIRNPDNSNVGATYMEELKNLSLIPTMKLYANFHEILSNRRMMSVYPNLINDMMKTMFTVDGKLPERMDKAMFKTLKNHISFGELISDGWKGFKAI